VPAWRLPTGEDDPDLERPGRRGLSRRHQRRRGLAEHVGEELGDLICTRSIETPANLMSSIQIHSNPPEIQTMSIGRSAAVMFGHSPGLPAAELAGPSTTE
jgi:hypothetical protein